MSVDQKVKKASIAWVTVRKIVQAVSLLAFFVLFILLVKGVQLGNTNQADAAAFPLRLDPLVVLSQLLASRTFLIGSSAALIVILLTLLFGRVWCGWLCPLGTLLDWFPIRRWEGKRARVSDSWRRGKYILLLTILISALFTNLTLLVFDPLTILYRTLSTAVWPALDQLITSGEAALFKISFLGPAVSRFDSGVRRVLLPTIPVFYRYAWLNALFFLGIIGLNGLAPRFWCRYLCPLGGMLGLISKGAVVKCQIEEASCTSCQLCEPVCPTEAIRGGENSRCDHSECIMCLRCQEECSQGAVSFPLQPSLSAWHEFDPGRREAVTALGAALVGLGLFQSARPAQRPHPQLIRPPGTLGNDFLSQCVRCGECLAACPTGAIQLSLGESGLEGVWTPILIPRLGYCDYSCHACGQACPVEAIPPLSLEEKREQVIGKAYLDHDRCLAWADNTDCIVCEEMCPLPEKAITLREAEFVDEQGSQRFIQQPYVNRDLCIGCGICEYQCPVPGEAAIRVYTPDPSRCGSSGYF